MSGNPQTHPKTGKAKGTERTSERDWQETYYSLGIVLDRDIKNGSFWPSYVLCAAQTTSNKRSGYRVVKQFGKQSRFNLQKVLVTSIYGHDDMLDYLSDYRTQDEMHGVHYYPSGALCWFETNRYGDPTGNVFYVRKVPDMELLKIPRRQRGYKKFVKQQQIKPTIKELLTRERPDTEVWEFRKPRFINKGKE